MNEATVAAAASGGRPKVSKISEAVIRIAGNSQDGIQAIGGFLARLAGRSEQEVMTFMTIPSTISGGPSIFQVRVGSGEVLSPGDEADLLIAFYQHSYEDHIKSLRKGGIVLYDSDHVQPSPEWQQEFRHVGVPISSLTVEAIGGTGKDKGKNVFVLGLVAKMFDLNVPKLEKLIGERFGGKDESILNNALTAFHAGYSHSLENILETFQFVEGQKRAGHQVDWFTYHPRDMAWPFGDRVHVPTGVARAMFAPLCDRALRGPQTLIEGSKRFMSSRRVGS